MSTMRFSVPNIVLFAAMAAASALPVTKIETAVSVPGELVPTTGLSVLAPAWSLTTWSSTSCNSGDVLNWSVPARFKGCTTLNNVRSMRLNDFGSCNTAMYVDANCKNRLGSGNIGQTGVCTGASDGSLVRSIYVECTTK